MNSIVALQGWLAQILGLAALALEVYALVDAARHTPEVYVAAGKRTKGFWLGLTGAAGAVGFLSIWNVLSLLSIAAIVVASVYLADVRPALRSVRGRGGRSGPYGPW